ncbi:MAG: N-acetyl sugar amidotransferase [Rhodospirillales bacterium]|nr:N-acetyl sugar amidotransferase [Rhodospirillales bacterium]
MQKIDVSTQYNLPKEVRYCKRCVISNQRPRMAFNEDGICFACLFADYKNNSINWDNRERELRDLLDRYRRKDGGFDVIVPSSGGKDSAIVAHKLKYEFGMNPLTVTWAPHKYTEIGWENFQGLIHSGLDNIMGHPNGIIHRKLTKLALFENGDPFTPFVFGQVLFPLRVALQFGIKLIFSGENGEAEYSGDPAAWDKRGFAVDEYARFWFSGNSVEQWLDRGFSRADLAMYLPPDQSRVLESGIERHFWSYYKKWIPQENFYYAAEHTGFKPNPLGRSEGTYSKYASLDDRIDGFHYYFALLKFGHGRATSDAAHEIRDGHITREEGVALVRRYDMEFPKRHFNEFLEYCDITEDEFWEACEIWRNDNLWIKSGNEWKLKTQVS